MTGDSEKLTLYTYCKSSAAYRVRIALNLKKINYDPVYISLHKDKQEHYRQEYRQINPQAMVPALKVGPQILTQSTAIMEYLEENYPDIPLLPADVETRALARSYAQLIACDIHPLNNVRVLEYLRINLTSNEAQVMDWYRHWIQEGFEALESRLKTSKRVGEYCIGNTPGLADCYLVPQVYNAYRYHCEIESFPCIKSIYHNCLELEAFKEASPEQQADYQPQDL